jgi:hypothetical protein
VVRAHDDATTVGPAIDSAIPLVFEAYATVVLPNDVTGRERHDRAVLAVLSKHSASQPWWLGYLDTGVDDVVFHRRAEIRPASAPATVTSSRPALTGQTRPADATPPGHTAF